jgi:catechol 2,3-dioxygenase-like lactoylglutathione lyase family enzyme
LALRKNTIQSMRIDHVAYTSRDPQATHRFYSEVLELELVQAYAGSELMLVYALPGGGSLVFSASRNGESNGVENVAWQRRHVGLTVATRAEFDRWLERLKRLEVRHQLMDDERVYFSDPDGLVLELEVACETASNPAAYDILARW